LQRVLHPDNYAGEVDEEETIRATLWSALVNKAYETLRDPLKRAIYLYQQKYNLPYDEESAGNRLDDTELMEILELRERLESTSDVNTASQTLATTQQRRQRIIKEMEKAFDADDVNCIRSCIDRLRFYDTVIEAAETTIAVLNNR
jgi:molecular chaperone HscB